MATYPLDAWALLGDANRRSIVERLSAAPCTVSELADEMPISRPAVSQHLKVLKDAGIVHDSPAGRTRVYRIDTHRLERYRRQLDQFWADALGTIEAAHGEQEKGAG